MCVCVSPVRFNHHGLCLSLAMWFVLWKMGYENISASAVHVISVHNFELNWYIVYTQAWWCACHGTEN